MNGLGHNLVVNSVLCPAVCGCTWIRADTYYFCMFDIKVIVVFSKCIRINGA